MMNSLPIISIICPLYNKADYIRQTIDSVLAQSHANWEMIIVDDGSTDNSQEIVNEYKKKDSRIQLHYRNQIKDQKGGSVCRNIGIHLAQGAYIMFLDADDVLGKEVIENRMKLVNTFDAYDVWLSPTNFFYNVIGDYRVGTKGKVLSALLSRSKNNDKYLNRFLSYQLPWNISNPTWTKDFLVKINGFDERFTRLQDPELHTRALLNNCRIYDDRDNKRAATETYIRIDRQAATIGNIKFQAFIENAMLYIETFDTLLDNLGQTQKKKGMKGLVIGVLVRLENNKLKTESQIIDDLQQTFLRHQIVKKYSDIELQKVFRKYKNLISNNLYRSLRLHKILLKRYLSKLY